MLIYNRKNKALNLLDGVGLIGFLFMSSMPVKQSTHSVIVQASNLATVKFAAVASVGGEIPYELSIINAVGVKLTQNQINDLGSINDTRIGTNGTVKTAGAPQPDSFFNSVIETDRLHRV